MLFGAKKSSPEGIALKRIIEARRTGARTLLLRDMDLISLPPEIGSLKNLTDLSLYGNHLTTLPLEIGNMTNLTSLNLSNNQLTSLPIQIGSLVNLTSLVLSDNDLTDLPQELGYLKNLTSLYLSHNQLREVAPQICKLTNLTSLDLSDNKLSSLPQNIGSLVNLRILYIFNNQLTALPPEMMELTNLKELYLHNNPNLKIPPEILGPTRYIPDRALTNPVDIFVYYFRTRGGARPINEAKLILVGRGESGKTCIVNRLVRDSWVDGTEITKGIEITDWCCTSCDPAVDLHIWDFGGQEIMHATHQFFLTERSLYLLVINGRESDEDRDAEYWLKLISSFGGDSPVIVVLSKSSQHPFDLKYYSLREKYPQIREFIKTDSKGNIGFKELKRVIADTLDGMDSVHQSFPAAWFSIKDKLTNMREDLKKDYISFDQYRELCRIEGEKDEFAQEQLSRFLHNLGIALNYRDDPRLHDASVLNPRWVTEGIYRIINDPGSIARKGVVSLTELDTILDRRVYPVDKQRFLIDLMQRFNLCFKFGERNGQYLITDLLKKDKPKLGGEFAPERCLNFEYQYEFLPEGLIPRFIARANVLLDAELRWRSGAVLFWEGCRALVEGDTVERKVVVRVIGEAPGDRRRLLAVIRSDFKRIHDHLRMAPREMAPLPGFPEKALSYSKLLLFERNGRSEYDEEIEEKLVTFSISELINGINIGARQSDQEELGRETRKVSIFISYSHKDFQFRQELEPHLKFLSNQGFIGAWSDQKLQAGDELNEIILKEVRNADIFLALISPDYLASDPCYETELYEALEKYRVRQAKIIPVVIRPVAYHKTKFKRFLGLPKDIIPVDGHPKGRDAAWLEVENEIASLAEKIIGEQNNHRL